MISDPLAPFHPAVRQWFTAAFDGPTRPQQLGWPAIASGESTLILSPTGSGKTLCYLLPIVHYLQTHAVNRSFKCLIIAPSKDLCLQIDAVLAG